MCSMVNLSLQVCKEKVRLGITRLNRHGKEHVTAKGLMGGTLKMIEYLECRLFGSRVLIQKRCYQSFWMWTIEDPRKQDGR